MKKLILFCIVILSLLGVASCKSTLEEEKPTEENNPIENEENPNQEAPASSNKKVLIAYFSLAENMVNEIDAEASASMSLPGDVTRLAYYIQKYTGGDIFSIHTIKKYPNDFQAVVDENHNEAVNPKLEKKVENLEQYNQVFIGYPVWATNVPRAIRTFLEENDLSNKTVIPFCSHDGYGAGSSYSTIKSLSKANTLEGFASLGTQAASAQSSINEWLEKIGIKNVTSKVAIELVVGDVILQAYLNDTAVAKEFLKLLPQTMQLSRYADREYYGAIKGSISAEGERKRQFTKGEISYCPANNTFAIWFDKEEQTLGMDIIKIGEITSDYRVLEALNSSIEVTARTIA
ncbi:MAG: hypothetical protein K2N42_05120 [Anaeroplasmataceae bacterium]|nr:hypothetical protein [Anaeroplasmataceae bacterium]